VAAPGRASRGSLRTRTLLPAFKFRDGRHTTEPRSRPPALRRLSLAAARRSQPPGPSAAVRRRSLGRQALKSQGQLQVGYRRALASAGAVRGHIQPAASLRVSARLDSDGPASGWQRLLNAGHESLALHAGADRGRARGYYHSRPTRDCRTPRGRAAPASKSPLSDGPRPGPGRAGTKRASKFVDTVARRSAALPGRTVAPAGGGDCPGFREREGPGFRVPASLAPAGSGRRAAKPRPRCRDPGAAAALRARSFASPDSESGLREFLVSRRHCQGSSVGTRPGPVLCRRPLRPGFRFR
jgi:hypothetical protein